MRPFLFTFTIGFLLLSTFVAISYFFFDIRALTCRGAGYKANTFMAYCNHPAYGDYEHGAYYFDLENVNAHLKKADVLFLGNSRIQFALSTNVTADYFNKNNLSYYLLGFGYDEGDEFVKMLQDKYHWQPKVLIINTDPFFTKTSDVTKAISNHTITEKDYRLKKTFQTIHRLISPVSPQSKGAFYRSSQNGQWVWEESLKFPQSPFPIDAKKAAEIPFKSEAISQLFDLVQKFKVKKQCVILTSVTNNQVNSISFTKRLAQVSKIRFFIPNIQGLKTVDGSHLDYKSAQKWSDVFLNGIQNMLKSCI
ncbi:hypothetical protein [Terasakiella sp. SH-1]|uniref:hypothetical protein n=1 Tax=Terasakiella sp. SH-1 TaxID=2560057 RepID=UPI0010731979|nr:hypothetical protein [Terasakiella sp. SH-1]